ncbi:MAG: NusG domain II-containing protein [Fusobacteriaceae bacterium]
MRKTSFFKIGDLLIYGFFIIIFSVLGNNIINKKDLKGSKVEVYVSNQLKYAQKLQNKEKNIFIDTKIGGVNIQFKENKVRVTTSNSPRKLAVKQGWITSPGELIIGIPDELIVKIIGEVEEELDGVAK